MFLSLYMLMRVLAEELVPPSFLAYIYNMYNTVLCIATGNMKYMRHITELM
jgi:hypothetical protein